MRQTPYEQGDLDGLCGLYSLVNGIHFLLQVDPPPGFTEDLFEMVARSVPRKLYPEVLWDGLNVDGLVRTAKRTASQLKADIGFDIEVATPFARRRFKTRDQFFDGIGEHLLARYSEMIVFIEWPKKNGGHAHWSVLKEITGDKIKLIDSGGQKHLPISRLAISGDRGLRIVPKYTVMLTLAGLNGEKFS